MAAHRRPATRQRGRSLHLRDRGHPELLAHDRLLSSSSTTGSIVSTPSTRSSRFSVPAQRANVSSSSPSYPSCRRRSRSSRASRSSTVIHLARRLAEDRLVEPVDPPQLLERPLVVVHAQVDDDVREVGVATVLLHDEKRGRLLAAAVAARCLRRVETGEEPFAQRLASACLEGVRHRVHRCLGDEDVSLRRVAAPDSPAGPVEALRAGERGGATLLGRRRRAGGGRVRRRRRSGVRPLPQPRDLREGAPAPRARSAGWRRPASQSRRHVAPPTGRSSRRRGTSTASRRPSRPVKRSHAAIEYVPYVSLIRSRSTSLR